MAVHKIEKAMGIEVHLTKKPGTGGVIRSNVEDFVVEEVLVDGSQAKIEPAKSHALNATFDRKGFLLCVLTKRNWDTFIAIKNVARQLRISQDQIDIAGIKDAKAITAQHITIGHATRKDVERINIKDVEIHPVGYFRDKLSPYYLLGNNFRITIKSVNMTEHAVANRVKAIMQEIELAGGFPNFYGHQRFGTTRSITHRVGKAIIKNQIEEAVMLFLAEPSAYEHPSSQQARKELQSTQNFKGALKNFPKQLRYERLILAHLVEKPGDFVGALKRLPTKLQTLFIQAYQSHLFNCFLSKRIRSGFKFNKVEIGEYVVNVEHVGLPVGKTGRIVNSTSLVETNEDLETGRLRAALPLVGFKRRPSKGAMGQMERQVLEAEGVETEDFKIDVLPELSVQGGLRTIIAPISNFKVRKISRDSGMKACQFTIGFMLLRGSYATVLLREIMKPKNPVTAGF